MGSCVSVHKNSESFMKLRFSIGSKSEKLMISSPVKDKAVTVNAGDRTDAVEAAVSSMRSPVRYISVGSKDEAFFDSQPWMESDCEDDFFSVNGDLTPSRGNTPVHPNSSLGKSKLVVNKLHVEEANGSPPDKKKRLSELFQESLRNDEYYYDDAPYINETPAATTLAQQLKSSNDTPYLSRANSRGSCETTTPNGHGVLGVEEKPLRSPMQCCLPNLLSSRSLNERKKSTPSPARNVG